ncbi:hypothetical protein GCM10022421_31980 [Oceanisphaera sediminis]|uniref:Arc-like DNA binding domain-containing protein n=1 Tax=Oceanisphaera sediminis TaxID=981381 RepID=A0ABP7EM32_9GAMM
MELKAVKPYSLRMQPDLKEMLQLLAKENGRSLNSEMIQRLKESVKNERRGQ